MPGGLRLANENFNIHTTRGVTLNALDVIKEGGWLLRAVARNKIIEVANAARADAIPNQAKALELAAKETEPLLLPTIGKHLEEEEEGIAKVKEEVVKKDDFGTMIRKKLIGMDERALQITVALLSTSPLPPAPGSHIVIEEISHKPVKEEKSSKIRIKAIPSNLPKPQPMSLVQPPIPPSVTDRVPQTYGIFAKAMAAKGYALIDVKPDGNCLYRSLSYAWYGTEKYWAGVKALILKQMNDHYYRFESIVNLADDNIIQLAKSLRANSIEEDDILKQCILAYTKIKERPNDWGGAHEIQVAVELCGRDFKAFKDADYTETQNIRQSGFFRTDAQRILTNVWARRKTLPPGLQTPFCLGYIGNAHYNAILRKCIKMNVNTMELVLTLELSPPIDTSIAIQWQRIRDYTNMNPDEEGKRNPTNTVYTDPTKLPRVINEVPLGDLTDPRRYAGKDWVIVEYLTKDRIGDQPKLPPGIETGPQ